MAENSLDAVAPEAEARRSAPGDRLQVVVPLGEGLTRAYLLHHRVCPVRFDDNLGGTSGAEQQALVVAVAPDADLHSLNDISIVYDSPVTTTDASNADIERLIEQLTTQRDVVTV